jgi:DNA polymerase elongation subunit (family B)
MGDTLGYVIDVETAPIEDVDDYLSNNHTAPSTYKKPEAIAKYVAEAKAKERGDAALNIDLCRLVAVCYQAIGQPLDVKGWIARNATEEQAMLCELWGMLRGQYGPATLYGHNILNFDVPVLLRRSLYLGVTPVQYDLGKYRHDRIVDTQQILSYNGMLKYRSKNFYAKRFGIVEAGDFITGADVGKCIARGDYETVLNHCRTDVRVEYRLAEAIGAIS